MLKIDFKVNPDIDEYISFIDEIDNFNRLLGCIINFSVMNEYGLKAEKGVAGHSDGAFTKNLGGKKSN